MSGELDGKVAVVTGGGTGIGLGIAVTLAEQGASVAIASRSSENLRNGAQALAKAGHDVLSVVVDVRSQESIETMFDTVTDTLGVPTILVNNAGANFVCRAEDLTFNGWKAIQETVLWGSWFTSVAMARRVFDHGPTPAVICNILSTVVLSGAAGRAHSASAKAGVSALTKSLAVEWADRSMRVVAVAPGPVATDGSTSQVWAPSGVSEDHLEGIPLGRLAEPRDIGNAVAFLCSPKASFITGETVVVDGGTWLAGATYGPRLAQKEERGSDYEPTR